MAGGHSSVGRALEWHSRGRRFDSAWLHHPAKRENGACGCSSGVEHNLAKVGVEGSNPFARSNSFERGNPSKRRPLGRLSCLGLKQTGPLHAGAGPAVTRGHTSLTFHPGKPVRNSRLSGRRCLQRSMSRRGGGLQPRRNRYASLHPVMPGRVPGLSIFAEAALVRNPHEHVADPLSSTGLAPGGRSWSVMNRKRFERCLFQRSGKEMSPANDIAGPKSIVEALA